MAETVTVPSPSLVLKSPDPSPRILPAAKKNPPAPLSANKSLPKASETVGVTKRKQSKSRNGCTSCKAKRLKCDETKPTCKQCARRGVTCGGYKKDFKWRPFEEPNCPGKSSGKPRKDSELQIPESAPSHFFHHSSYHNHQNAFTGAPQDAGYHTPPFSYPFMHGPPVQTSFPQQSLSSLDGIYAVPYSSSFILTPQSISPVESYAPRSLQQSIAGTGSIDTSQTATTESSIVSPGQSPRPTDVRPPGVDLHRPPKEYSSFLSQPETIFQPAGPISSDSKDDRLERSPCSADTNPEAWMMQLPSPSLLSSCGSSTDFAHSKIPAQIQPPLNSAECLTRKYDRHTCGVLSVKDGPTENPWRTLVWPLARDCPALYHAIASMTSFHQSRDTPTMRIQGIDHMRNAVHALAAGLQDMRFDAAISTTLVLAFSESWDHHISTGINHIKGAKLLINQALVQHRHTPMRGVEWIRLKFLCNTWIYMDVIARLTSADDDETNDVDAVQECIYATGETETHIDPLMGCAHTLFPIIGRVANLVKKVRRTSSNSPEIIRQAGLLKSQLEEWTPPSFIEDPEDETTSPHDSIKTAVAYQYATLLYLHQAVPEIPSQSSSALAKRALCELATVDPRSRSIIVQIYPLLAAGCEATNREDREWIKERWGLMSSRMKLGIIERCLEVTKEVWNRRDKYIADRLALQNEHENFSPETSKKRDLDVYFNDFDPNASLGASPKRRSVDSMSSCSAPFPSPVCAELPQWPHVPNAMSEWLEPMSTVKGRLHWLGVMKDWEWEILLG